MPLRGSAHESLTIEFAYRWRAGGPLGSVRHLQRLEPSRLSNSEPPHPFGGVFELHARNNSIPRQGEKEPFAPGNFAYSGKFVCPAR